MKRRQTPCSAALFFIAALSLALVAQPSGADDFGPTQVGITPQLPGISVIHDGKRVWVERNQDQTNLVDPEFTLTSRACPPFCIQPMRIADGLQTLGELEMLDYLARLGRDPKLLVIDARSEPEYRAGAIPGAVNVPWTDLVESVGAVDFIIEERLSDFGGIYRDAHWDFSAAKTLVVYDNGPWCGQASTQVRALLRLGFPAERIKWYRGGLQDWRNLGLTVIDPM